MKKFSFYLLFSSSFHFFLLGNPDQNSLSWWFYEPSLHSFVKQEIEKNIYPPFLENSHQQMADFDDQTQGIIPKELLLKTAAAKQWERVGLYNHNGFIAPLFSLYSLDSMGCGDFFDLLPLISWAKKVGFDTVQLLPMNDCTNSPFDINSFQALDLIYINLKELPHAETINKYIETQRALTDKGRKKRLQWDFVRIKKEIFLRAYFKRYFSEIANTSEYKNFINDNASWLDGYALYKTLKRAFGHTVPWERWPDPLRKADPDALVQIAKEHKEKLDFFKFVQFLCFKQMTHVKKIASAEGIFLVGDLPFIANKDSADVWLNQASFFTRVSAGAPPDQFSELGQDWGLPVYNWPEIEKNGYKVILQRVAYATQFYHIYRIDHAYGLYRTWYWKDRYLKIDEENKKLDYKVGSFLPYNSEIWQENAEKIFNLLLENFDELFIAEDIGNYEPGILSSIRNLGIPGIRSLFAGLLPKKDGYRLSFKYFPPNSVTMLSSHDTQPLRLFWLSNPKKAKAISKMLGWPYEKEISREHIFDILKISLNTPSLFHINLLQEYLALVPELSQISPQMERINIPGTTSELNWSYRFPVSIEKITQNKALQGNIIRLMENGGYIPSAESKPIKENNPYENWYQPIYSDQEFSQLDDKDLERLGFVLDNLGIVELNSPCPPPVRNQIIGVLDVMKAALCQNPLIDNFSLQIQDRKGKYISSKGPFDPEFVVGMEGISSFDNMYPPQDVRTDETGSQLLGDAGFRKKMRSGATLSAAVSIDQNLNRLIPVYGPEPINNLNTAVIEFEFRQPLLKDCYWNRDAVQERINRLAIRKAYYAYLEETSKILLDTIHRYWEWVAGHLFVNARKESLARVESAYKHFLDLYELQLVSREDILQLKGWINERKDALIFAENIENHALQKLRLNMGVNDDNICKWFPPIRFVGKKFYDLTPEVHAILSKKEDLITQAQERNYGVLASRIEQMMQYIALEGAENQLLPRLDVFAGAAFTGFDVENNANNYFSSLRFPTSTEKDFRIGIEVSTPLFRDKAKGEVLSTCSNLNQAKNTTLYLRQKAQEELLDNLFKISSLPKVIECAGNAVEQNRELMSKEAAKSNSGAVFAFIEFDRRFNNAVNDQIIGYLDLMKSLTQIYYTLGFLIDGNSNPIDPTNQFFIKEDQVLWKLTDKGLQVPQKKMYKRN